MNRQATFDHFWKFQFWNKIWKFAVFILRGDKKYERLLPFIVLLNNFNIVLINKVI